MVPPVDYDLTPEQEMLRRTVREFAEREIAPRMLELDEREEFSCELTTAMGELGLFGMTTLPSTAARGWTTSRTSSRSRRSRASTARRRPPSRPKTRWESAHSTTTAARSRSGGICRPVRGDHALGFGLTEPSAGSDAGGTKTTARLEGGPLGDQRQQDLHHQRRDADDGGVDRAMRDRHPRGRQQGVQLHHRRAGYARVTARSMHRKLVWRASNTAELYFDNVSVPRDNLVGERGTGFHQMLATLDSGRLSIAAMGLGGAQGAFEAALAYARERRQFGKSISHSRRTRSSSPTWRPRSRRRATSSTRRAGCATRIARFARKRRWRSSGRPR